ncbi:MAG: 16S rRNA (uracil(1498)-N(3))-methyltransferase [Pleurocapsa sp.]
MYRLVIKPDQKQDNFIDLNPEQQHYLFRVLRLGKGDRFIALDGLGMSWIAEIEGLSAKICQEIDISTELPARVTLISALPKGSSYEEIIRCCTELGVSNFVPVISDRTILKPSSNKVQRWRKIATEAAEQSERQIVPVVSEPIAFDCAIAGMTPISDKYICLARGNFPSLGNCLTIRQSQEREIIIATGCEGGWTEREINRAIALNYRPVSLGNRILRAVTAPIVALSLIVAALES